MIQPIKAKKLICDVCGHVRMIESKDKLPRRCARKACQSTLWNSGKKPGASTLCTAIRQGILIPEPCEVCGNKAIAHHDNYEFPLAVRWLCVKHHRLWHAQNGPGRNKAWFEREWSDTQGVILMLGDTVTIAKSKWKVDQSITLGQRQKVRLVPILSNS